MIAIISCIILALHDAGQVVERLGDADVAGPEDLAPDPDILNVYCVYIYIYIERERGRDIHTQYTHLISYYTILYYIISDQIISCHSIA